MKVEIKKVKVDGEIRIQAWNGNQFLEEVDIDSSTTILEATNYLKQKYSK